VAPVPIPEVSTDELAALAAAGARIIDVRQPDEYEAGHVPGAESIPLATVADHLDRFATDAPNYLICATGRRSLLAAELAVAEGLRAVNVAGGTGAWLDSGRQVVTGTSAS
jgi:rhodanese-related sulfurtransferase